LLKPLIHKSESNAARRQPKNFGGNNIEIDMKLSEPFTEPGFFGR
jgi:hypothetical protein